MKLATKSRKLSGCNVHEYIRTLGPQIHGVDTRAPPRFTSVAKITAGADAAVHKALMIRIWPKGLIDTKWHVVLHPSTRILLQHGLSGKYRHIYRDGMDRW
jgi:hypothetical protein